MIYWGVNSQNGRYCDWLRAGETKGDVLGCDMGEVDGNILVLEVGDVLD